MRAKMPKNNMKNIRGIERISREFRKGLLGKKSSNGMCFAVCSALAGYLRFVGQECEVTEGEISHWQHFWITLPDGIIIDPTADQLLKPDGNDMPEFYIGRKPEWYKKLK